METGFFVNLDFDASLWVMEVKMKKGSKQILAGILLCLCVCLLVPVTASAKTHKRILNEYITKSKKYTVLAYNNSQSRVYIYTKADNRSKCLGSLGYGDAVIVNTSKLVKNKEYAWLPIYLNNRKTKNGPATAWVVIRNMKLEKMYTKTFSKNKTIDKAIKVGMQYLGTPFELGKSSLSSAIDCSNFVVQCFRRAGKNLCSWAHTNNLQAVSREIFYHRKNKLLTKKQLSYLKAGDLLFYLEEDTHGPIDHVAIYIGNGFMINSSGHYGDTYPMGGVTIKRVQYGNRYIVRCMRIYGY